MTRPIAQKPASRPTLADRVATSGQTKRSRPRGRAAATKNDAPSFRDILERSAARMAAGEHMIERAMRSARSGNLSNERLLALQAGVYRYTREVELAGKLVERSTSALKQTLQSQQ